MAQRELDRLQPVREAARVSGIPIRTFYRLIKKGRLEVKVPLQRPRRRRAEAVRPPEKPKYQRIWTAADLENIFHHTRWGRIILMLQIRAYAGHWRLHEWIDLMRDGVRKTHPTYQWRALIGFLPIFARDLQAPTLTKLGDLALDILPWEDKRAHRQYLRAAAPIMRDAILEIEAWTLRHHRVFPRYSVTAEGQALLESFDMELTVIPGVTSDATSAPLPDEPNLGEPIYRVLSELLRRLPDVEPRKGARNPFGAMRGGIAGPIFDWLTLLEGKEGEEAHG